MADRSKVDDKKYEEITTVLMALYPKGEDHFPTLAPTLRYIADTMQEFVNECPDMFNINTTGVTH